MENLTLNWSNVGTYSPPAVSDKILSEISLADINFKFSIVVIILAYFLLAQIWQEWQIRRLLKLYNEIKKCPLPDEANKRIYTAKRLT